LTFVPENGIHFAPKIAFEFLDSTSTFVDGDGELEFQKVLLRRLRRGPTLMGAFLS
jgi:hypothetical protein